MRVKDHKIIFDDLSDLDSGLSVLRQFGYDEEIWDDIAAIERVIIRDPDQRRTRIEYHIDFDSNEITSLVALMQGLHNDN